MPESVAYHVENVNDFIQKYLDVSVQQETDQEPEDVKVNWNKNKQLSVCLTHVMRSLNGELVSIGYNSQGEPVTVAWKQVHKTPGRAFFIN